MPLLLIPFGYVYKRCNDVFKCLFYFGKGIQSALSNSIQNTQNFCDEFGGVTKRGILNWLSNGNQREWIVQNWAEVTNYKGGRIKQGWLYCYARPIQHPIDSLHPNGT